MQTPFPGMDPYLEQPYLAQELHTGLIAGMQRFLTPLLRPHYRVAIEQRVYLAPLPPPDQSVGKPDVLLYPSAPSAGSSPSQTMLAQPMVFIEPQIGFIPTTDSDEVKDRYLEIRAVDNQEVVTVIELLSPTKKRARTGRDMYEVKREKVLRSATHLVEIDLLRANKPMPIQVEGRSHYRIILSRSPQRPQAQVYQFSVRQPIPDFPIPLREGEPEPTLKLNQILHELYDQSGYDLAIYYRHPPPPTFAKADMEWVMEVSQE